MPAGENINFQLSKIQTSQNKGLKTVNLGVLVI